LSYARHTVGYFGDDLHSKSFDWCKTVKTKHHYYRQQHKNVNNHARKLLKYEQAKPSEI